MATDTVRDRAVSSFLLPVGVFTSNPMAMALDPLVSLVYDL